MALGVLTACAVAATTPQGGVDRGPGDLSASMGDPAPQPTGAFAGPANGGVLVDDDVLRWRFWWEFHRDAFLREPSGSAHSRTSPTAVPPLPTAEIAAALAAPLHGPDDRSLTPACLIALAKCVREGVPFDLPAVTTPRLQSAVPTVRDAAVLAFGIAEHAEGWSVLPELVRDSGAGRRLVASERVDVRMRTFVCYALALFARAHDELPALQRALPTLRTIVVDEAIEARDLQIAAILGISLLAPRMNESVGIEHVGACLDTLSEAWARTDHALPRGSGPTSLPQPRA